MICPEASCGYLLREWLVIFRKRQKITNPIFTKVSASIIGNNAKALEAAKQKAEELGLDAAISDALVQGEARGAGTRLAREALAIQATRIGSQTKPLCLISGGETTVTVREKGKGGRNMELALAFAMEVDGTEGLTFLSAGTDGGDGPTDSAGAIVDGTTARKGRSIGAEPVTYLRNNDSYNYFEKTGELLITGPTGTNVMDLQIILVHPQA